MNVIKKSTLKEYWDKHPISMKPLLSWHEIVSKVVWLNPNQMKDTFPNADIIKDNRVVFNIGGNNFRMIANVEFRIKSVFILWIGSHADYNKINAETVEYKK